MKAAIKIISYLWVLAFSTFFVTILYANFVGPLPLALSDYISTFQWALEAFLSSWLFGVFFIVGWFVVSFQMSQKSGWGKIAKHYKCTSQQPDTLKKFYMGSGRVGSIAHNNMLRIDGEGLEVERYRSMRIHLIHTEQEVEKLSASSKMNAQWNFVSSLYLQGRDWGDQWLESHFDDLGKRSTFDLDAVFSDTFRPIERKGSHRS